MNTFWLGAARGGLGTSILGVTICVMFMAFAAGCGSRTAPEIAVEEDLATVPASLTTMPTPPIDGTRTEALALAVANLRGQVETNVDLSFTGVTDDDLTRLEFPDTVRTINLSNTRVTDRGVEYLIRIRNLETLVLMNTQVSEAVVDILKRMPSLCEVRLDNTQVSTAAQIELVHYFTPRIHARTQRQSAAVRRRQP